MRKQIDVLLKAELQNLKAREEADEKAAQVGKKSKKGKKGKGKKGKGKKGKAKGKGKKDKTEAPPPPMSAAELEVLFAKYVMIGCVQEVCSLIRSIHSSFSLSLYLCVCVCDVRI